jgi:RimJ/RimL family protein N-acetyltransferase
VFSNHQLTFISFTGPSTNVDEAQRSLAKNHLPLCEHEGDVRKYRASYSVYVRAPDGAPSRPRDAARFVGRVGAGECREYGAPFPDRLAAPADPAGRGRILRCEVGYGLLERAWGRGYATEALRALVRAYVGARALWSPPFERVHLLGVTGAANAPSRRVLEKVGFRLNGVHRWEGEDVFIGGAMQPPEVCVYSFDPAAVDGEVHGGGDP